MSRNKKYSKGYQDDKNSKGKGSRPDKNGGKDKKYSKKDTTGSELLDATNRPNNPNWYFTDAQLADQVSQLSFQQLAGLPIEMGGRQWSVPNMVRIEFNPCPGVIDDVDYNSPSLNKTSGINLAGFRIFSKLSAYTGRTATYGPQDISIMILAMGEVISMMEWCRRAFGVSQAMSMRNRSYPRDVLDWGMLLDSDDLFKNFANYRTRFNGLVTLINQLPIPKGIQYFDKCAALYENIYFDDDSTMAQSLITNPFTTWVLDEAIDPRGSVLITTDWHADPTSGYDNYLVSTAKTMGDYLDIVDSMVAALLNSSTLQVVYTDLLNLALKVGQEFWKLDYLLDGYTVIPTYNENVLLQIHNATIVGAPIEPSEPNPPVITKWNNVVPNPATNSLFYNPGFWAAGQVNGVYVPKTLSEVIIDMTTSSPRVEDRVECTRYTSVAGTKPYDSNKKFCNATLPDHYVVVVSLYCTDNNLKAMLNKVNATLMVAPNYKAIVSAASAIDWFPRFYEFDNTGTGTITGNYAGDLNYYTVVDAPYLRRLHQFMTLGLYDLRSGK